MSKSACSCIFYQCLPFAFFSNLFKLVLTFIFSRHGYHWMITQIYNSRLLRSESQNDRMRSKSCLMLIFSCYSNASQQSWILFMYSFWRMSLSMFSCIGSIRKKIILIYPYFHASAPKIFISNPISCTK